MRGDFVRRVAWDQFLEQVHELTLWYCYILLII